METVAPIPFVGHFRGSCRDEQRHRAHSTHPPRGALPLRAVGRPVRHATRDISAWYREIIFELGLNSTYLLHK